MEALPIDLAFEKAIQDKVFSGAQVFYGRGQEQLFSKAYGTVQHDPQSRMVVAQSLFDIASLTKPLATTVLAMLAVQEGLLKLHDPVVQYLPNFDRKDKITLRQLLEHSSGLPAWLPLYQETLDKGWSYDQVVDYFIQSINRAPLVHPPGTSRLYSDLGFILLGFVLEDIHGLRLPTLFETCIAERLALTQSFYNPLNFASLIEVNSIVATEACPWRGKILQGEVHDDNAYVLGGAAGHAGLFSNAGQIRKIVLLILETLGGEKTILSPKVVRQFIDEKLPFQLGWDTVSPSGSQAGKYFSPKHSIGHLAFTGCSLWIDLSDQKYIIFLSNRVHPKRDSEAIKEFRPKIHDLLIEHCSE